ncbi:MAG TPA: WbuC family cupin fold metalloprotein [Stenomitos sp.]
MKLEFAGPLRPIDRAAVSRAQGLAEVSPRHRAIVRYHDHAEPIQRMLNAVAPESYVRPHRHADPAKLEVFLALTGRALVLTFDDAGTVTSFVEIAPQGPCWGVEIPAGTWHSVVALESGTTLYELIEGAFEPSTHKDYAPWAPPEGSEEGRRFQAALQAHLAAE